MAKSTKKASQGRRSRSNEPSELMDPEQLFQFRYKYAVSHSDGIERFAYKVLPVSLLRSFTLTFDPTTKFRLGNQKVSPITRTRKLTKNMLLPRSIIGRRRSVTESRYPSNFNCTWPNPPVIARNDADNTIVLGAQQATSTVIRDTTRATRPTGMDYGEFEKFKFDILSPDRSAYSTRTDRSFVYVNNCALVGYSRTDARSDARTTGGAASFSQSNIDSVRTSSISELVPLMKKKVTEMLPSTIPMSRRYNLARSIAELKDLPRTVHSLQVGVRDLARAIELAPRNVQSAFRHLELPKNIPDQWLSYWFGWRLLYVDLINLLKVPERISKEVNYLISRRGLPTTFRSLRTEAGDVTASPSFSFSSFSGSTTGFSETVLGQEVSHRRKHTYRLVLNATFDFPEVGVPKLRRELYERKFGASLDPLKGFGFGLTVTDLYNLFPWSWLVDWFIGLGNYVDMIDSINTDPSLFNWGFLTGITDGEIVHTYRTRTQSTYNFSTQNPTSSYSAVTNHDSTNEARFVYQTQVRKNIVSAYGVKSTLEPSTLSSYQASIVSAIAAARARR